MLNILKRIWRAMKVVSDVVGVVRLAVVAITFLVSIA